MAEVTLLSGRHETEWIAISLDEYESMKRTIEVLSDPELMDQIKRSAQDIKAGRVKKWGDVVKELGLR